MLSFTFPQMVILLLVLLLGWLLGLASRSGGKRWRDEAEQARARADAADARINAANARIAEFEARNTHPIGAGTAAAVGAAASGGLDDLSLIRGIGRDGELRLNEAGYHRFRQVAEMSDTAAAALEGRLGATPGTIDREEWRAQAKILAASNHDEHRRRWG